MTLSDVLIFCSGADKSILDECPSEKTKYHGIGSTVLLTSLLAMLSGGYAVYFTFNNFFISFALGVFWGIVIFSLDRYIVSSIKKVGDFRKELPMALPRIFMALVLAITISKPLELRLFQDAVNKGMGEIADASISSCEKDFNNERDRLAESKSQLESERKTKTDEIYSKDGVYNNLKIQLNGLQEKNKDLSARVIQNNKIIIQGTSYKPIYDRYGNKNGQRKILSPAAQSAQSNNKVINSEISSNNSQIRDIDGQMKSRADELKEQVVTTEEQYKKQIAGVQQQIDDHNSKRSSFLSDCSDRAKNAQDIPARLEALSKITSENSSIWMASILITLLFVLLETAPVVVKLLSVRGPYDEILERIEYEKIMNEKIKISNLNEKINNELKIISQKNKNLLDAELKANKELLDSIASAQAEIAKEAVKKWKEDELNKLVNGNNNIINS